MDQARTYKYLFILADLVLLAVAGSLASQVILSVLVPPAGLPRSSPVTVAKADVVPGKASAPNAELILKRNLFGSKILAASPAKTEKTEADLESLPESTLPLELLGTVVQVNGKRSFAIIQDTSTRKQQLYFVDDEIQEGTTVTSVTRNRVVLLRNGKEEILEKEEDQSPSSAPSSARQRPSRSVRARTSDQDSNAVAVRKVGDNNFVMDRREVDGVLQDFNKLLTQIRVVPHFADGKPDGFKVFNIRPGSLFASLGMVNGDIIKRVNGLDITGPEQALQMFQQLRDESQVTVDLERFRKNLTLNYEIR
jgi:general secretion pathway protein C